MTYPSSQAADLGFQPSFYAACDSHTMQASLVKRHGVPQLEPKVAAAGPGGGVATESHLLDLASYST